MSRSLLRVGQKIKDPYSRLSYRIEEALGSGGFGQTFRGGAIDSNRTTTSEGKRRRVLEGDNQA